LRRLRGQAEAGRRVLTVGNAKVDAVLIAGKWDAAFERVAPG
jgi:hypothetical protein